MKEGTEVSVLHGHRVAAAIETLHHKHVVSNASQTREKAVVLVACLIRRECKSYTVVAILYKMLQSQKKSQNFLSVVLAITVH